MSSLKLSKADIFALENLSVLASKAMMSKTVLKQITSLQDRGLVEYDPFSASASLTGAGRRAANSGGERS